MCTCMYTSIYVYIYIHKQTQRDRIKYEVKRWNINDDEL